MHKEREIGYSSAEEADIIGWIRKAELLNDFDSITGYIFCTIPELHGKLDFAALEDIFRRNSLRVALLAIPSTIFQSFDPTFQARDPFDVNITYPYTALVIHEGMEFRILQEMGKLGLNYDRDANLKNLTQAGLPMFGEDSDMFRRINAPEN